MIKLKVVTVTNNPKEYPQHMDASEEYPELVKYIDDECDTFVVDDRVRPIQFWPATEFFLMVSCDEFLVAERVIG